MIEHVTPAIDIDEAASRIDIARFLLPHRAAVEV